MELTLSEDQRLIAEAATDLLAEACDSRALRAAADSVDGLDHELWQRLVESGWCGVQAPEADGGMGLGWVELALLHEQLGRRLAGVPYFDSVALGACLLRAAGDGASALLAAVGAGSAVVVVAFGGEQARATSLAEGGWQLDGCWPQVDAAAWADHLLLCARDEAGEDVLLAAPASALLRRPLRSIDATRRRAEVRAEGVQLPASACLLRGAALERALRRTRDLGAIALAAELAGVARQCLDLTLAYTAGRVQFDRPIASFQAVKHRCAKMLVAIEAARSAVYGAATVVDADPDEATLAFHAAQALCAAVDAAQYAAQEAIQLHGGVGFTWEYDPQLYFKRAQAGSVRLGPVGEWRERVAAQLLDESA